MLQAVPTCDGPVRSKLAAQNFQGAGAAPAAAAAPEKPKEEEVDALDGGMDMFGGGDKGGGDY